MLLILYFPIGLALGYIIGSFIESILHEYVSDAPASWVRRWRCYPRLFRVPLNTYFSHHRYDGTSNFNLVLGADILRNRVRPPSRDDIQIMAEIGMPLD